MFVKLKDKGASFTDATQPTSLLMIGATVYEVEKTPMIVNGIRNGALVECEAPVSDRGENLEDADKPKKAKKD